MAILWFSIAILVMVVYCGALVKLFNSQPGRKGTWIFVITAGGVALIRIGVLWFLHYRFPSHTYTPPILSYILLPENAVIYLLNIHNPKWHVILLTILLVVGSFLWLSPLLLIGAKRKIAENPTYSKTL